MSSTVKRKFAAILTVFAVLAPTFASAAPVQATVDVEAVSIGPQAIQTDLFFRIRLVGPAGGRDAGDSLWLRVRGQDFGQEGVSRVQALLVSAMLGRNRMFLVFEDTDNRLTAIRLEK